MAEWYKFFYSIRQHSKGETPNCAKCKWSRVKATGDEQTKSAPGDAFSIFLGLRTLTQKGDLFCIAHGGQSCIQAHSTPTCRKLYEVDPLRIAELAASRGQ